MFLLLGMNLRVVQATDAARRWRLEDYLVLRHLLNVLATVVTMVVGLVLQMSLADLAALLAVSGAKSLESVSQTYYGFFQQSERHEYVAQSAIARSVTGPLLFATGYLLTGELAGGCVGLMVGWSIPQRFLDRRRAARVRALDGDRIHPLTPVRWREVRALARKSTPLGLDQGVSSLSVNIPRYFIQGTLGSAQLGVYASLSYLAQSISMVSGSLGVVVMPRLAKYHHRRQPRAYVRLLVMMSLASVLVVVVALLGALVLGEWFIQHTLGREYVDQEAAPGPPAQRRFDHAPALHRQGPGRCAALHDVPRDRHDHRGLRRGQRGRDGAAVGCRGRRLGQHRRFHGRRPRRAGAGQPRGAGDGPRAGVSRSDPLRRVDTGARPLRPPFQLPASASTSSTGTARW